MQLKQLDVPIDYYPNWINAAEANNLFHYLLENIPWQSEYLYIFGRRIKVPRLVCWMGDQGCSYRYSGVSHEAIPWLPEIEKISHQLNHFLNIQFNSVLCNLYHNGSEYMGWHQDNEPKLGPRPLIASISLGATRRFLLRHKQSKQKVEYFLESGSLLIMRDNCQKNWQHALPKSLKCIEPRINLTFRKIIQLPQL